ncbi:MAG: hypothetical protein ACC647_05615 [Anaerolineales bacterium]
MYCTADSEPRVPIRLHVLLVVMLTVSLLGHYMADAAGISPEIRTLGSGGTAVIGRSAEATSGSTSLLHLALSIGHLNPIQVLASLTLILMIGFMFRTFSPFPPLLRPPIFSSRALLPSL